MLRKRIPLAWCNLVTDKRRLAVSVAGITLAVVLMFMQWGFWAAFDESASALAQLLNGEVVLVARGRYSLTAAGAKFPLYRLTEARSVTGVAQAMPLYMTSRSAMWKDVADQARKKESPEQEDLEPASRSIRAVGVDPRTDPLADPEIRAQLPLLQRPYTVLSDRKSKSDYGDLGVGAVQEVSGKSVEVVGQFTLGTDFTTDGTLIMSDQTYASLFPNPLAPGSARQFVDVGVIRVAPGADPAAVKAALEAKLADDVWAFTHDEFVRQEKYFWTTSTPVGFIFLFGLGVGLVVGLVICWQILSADVSDHLKEYATLKAIGYTNTYLTLVVLQEAVWLAFLGYAPALLLSAGLYALLEFFTGLPLDMSPWRMAQVLALTNAMCIVSGILTLRKIYDTDPAEVF